MLKTFSIVDYPEEGKNYGKYKSYLPGKAASKAFTVLCKKLKYTDDNKDKFIVFSIIDNNKKKYEYIGTKVKLYKPIKVNGVNYNYRNIVVPNKDFYKNI